MPKGGVNSTICVRIAFRCYTSSVNPGHRLSYCVVLPSLQWDELAYIHLSASIYSHSEEIRTRSDGKQDKVTSLGGCCPIDSHDAIQSCASDISRCCTHDAKRNEKQPVSVVLP